MRLTLVPLHNAVQIIVVLKDNVGNPLPDKPIYIYVSNDGKNWIYITTLLTDEYGIATYTLGIHAWYKAVFPGNAQYMPSQAVVQYIVAPPCCAFADFACWFLQKGKCVQIFDYTVDSMILSIALIMAVVIIIILILRK